MDEFKWAHLNLNEPKSAQMGQNEIRDLLQCDDCLKNGHKPQVRFLRRNTHPLLPEALIYISERPLTLHGGMRPSNVVHYKQDLYQWCMSSNKLKRA